MRRVVVSGIGFVTSIGNDQPTVLANLRNLRHGIELFPDFASEKIPVKVVGTIKDFDTSSYDAEDWSYPSEYRLKQELLRSLSPHGLYAYCALMQAIEDAALTEDEISDVSTGLYTASGGSMSMIYRHLDLMNRKGVLRCPPKGIIASVAGTLNFNLVAHFKIRGSSSGFVSACSSSGHALGFAFNEIATGRQQRVLVVGAEDCNVESILPFAGMRLLSLSRDPDRASIPFDKNRNGFVGTGGAAAMILEDEECALLRGVDPYARFKGWGQASDGYHVAISHPEGEGLRVAMEQALKFSEVSRADIDYVNAHATSTLTGDLSEILALKEVFHNGRYRPAISSTKALTGHGISLASIMEAGFSVLTIKREFMPGSAGIEILEPEADGLNIIRETQERVAKTVMSNSSGFGGSNVSLIFEKI